MVGSLTQNIPESDCKKNKIAVPKSIKLLNKGKEEVVLASNEDSKKDQAKPSKPAPANNRISKAIDKSATGEELDTSSATANSTEEKKAGKSEKPKAGKLAEKPKIVTKPP